MSDIEATIREVLGTTATLSTPATALDVRDDLFDRGLTSLATVELMLALEGRLGVEFPDEALTRQTFRTIASLQDTLSRLGAAA
ncbi:acyl carrier protein [Muricoccus radiodurans]|uniref:acyl carrier protein n=1 Tax=Muricoccus radiodurans TaxID=2231721 RepID=UPI003CEF14F0